MEGTGREGKWKRGRLVSLDFLPSFRGPLAGLSPPSSAAKNDGIYYSNYEDALGAVVSVLFFMSEEHNISIIRHEDGFNTLVWIVGTSFQTTWRYYPEAQYRQCV
jgi:hypothetical protein